MKRKPQRTLKHQEAGVVVEEEAVEEAVVVVEEAERRVWIRTLRRNRPDH